MALYRVIQNLALKNSIVPRGAVSRLANMRLELIRILLAKGGIAEIAPPPLAVLPGWKTRAAKLSKLGIVTAVDFLEADDEAVLKLMKATPPVLAKWRREVEGWLFNPDKKGG